MVYWFIDGFAVALVHALLYQRLARPDGTGTLDVLEQLPVSPAGAQDLRRAEFWAGQTFGAPFLAVGIYGGMEWAGTTSGWPSEAVRIGTVALAAIGGGCVALPALNATTSTVLACCAIVRDQLRQATRRLEHTVSRCAASPGGEPEWDFRATTTELYRIKRMGAQCERASTSILMMAIFCYGGAGSLFAYTVASGESPYIAFTATAVVIMSICFGQTIDLLLGPLSVTTGAPPFFRVLPIL